MPIVLNQNFDIFINPPNPAGAYPLQVIKSPAGQTEEPSYQTLPKTIDHLLLFVQELVAERADMQELGEILFRFLFPPDIYRLFVESRSQLQEGQRLRLRLRWGDLRVGHDLGRLPWEYLYEPDSPHAGFLALNRQISLVRFLHGRPPLPINAPATLKVLAVTASPEDHPPLQLKTEIAQLQQAIQQVGSNHQIDLTILEDATPTTLRRAIEQHQPHIFHYAGHGQRGEKVGSLLLCDDDGKAIPYPASDLQVILQDSSVRVAILNGCETAAKPTNNDQKAEVPMQSIAGQLIKAKLAAVVGMQYRIPDQAALSFLTDLYQAIARDEPLDHALTQARIGLYADGTDKNHWAIPALYLQVDNGRLFNSDQDNQAQRSIRTIIDLIQQTPELLETIGRFRGELQEIQRTINIISFYKQIHDDLQTLETSYNLLVDDFSRLPQDEAAWDDLMLNEFELQDVISSMLTFTQNTPADIELGQWHSLLDRGRQAVQNGIEAQELLSVDKGLRYILRVLQKGLPDVNKSLVIYAKQLPLNKLTTSLIQLHQKAETLTEIKREDVAIIGDGIADLETMAAQLASQVTQHNHWQDFDDDLRRVESTLNGDLFELELSWPDLEERAADLFKQNDEQWAKSLTKLSGLIERSMHNKPVPAVINIFKRYRQQAVRRFRKVDDELLQLCQKLKEIGGPLDALLRLINE